MQVTYESPSYQPEHVTARYVRYCKFRKRFIFCEVGLDTRTDIRQGVVEEAELPHEVAHYARERCDTFPSYVRW